jgi:hypothetical protein
MKTKSNEPQKRNLAIPGKPMSKSEFIQLLKDAEKCPFISSEDFKKEMEGRIKKAQEKELGK